MMVRPGLIWALRVRIFPDVEKPRTTFISSRSRK
ncbi:MAG: hypothetical protein ACD_75C02216G0002, partial [uncultured bacterium]